MTFQRSPNNRTLKFTEIAEATAVNVAEVRHKGWQGRRWAGEEEIWSVQGWEMDGGMMVYQDMGKGSTSVQ